MENKSESYQPRIEGPHTPATIYAKWKENQEVTKTPEEKDLTREELAMLDDVLTEFDEQAFRNYTHIESTRLPGTRIPATTFVLDENALIKMYGHYLPGVEIPPPTAIDENTRPVASFISQFGFASYPVGHALAGVDNLFLEIVTMLPQYAQYVKEMKETGEKIEPVVFHGVGSVQSMGATTSDAYLETYRQQGFDEANGQVYGDTYLQLLQRTHALGSDVTIDGVSMGASIAKAAVEQTPELQDHMTLRLIAPSGGHGGNVVNRAMKGVQTFAGFLGEGVKDAMGKGRNSKRFKLLSATDKNIASVLAEKGVVPATPDELARKKQALLLDVRTMFQGTDLTNNKSGVPTEIIIGSHDPTLLTVKQGVRNALDAPLPPEQMQGMNKIRYIKQPTHNFYDFKETGNSLARTKDIIQGIYQKAA